MNGGCSSTSGTNNEICNGSSVLNDGILPALSGVSSDPASQWANELFTMNRAGTEEIVVSVGLPVVTPTVYHNHVELTVFNCPQWGIYGPQVTVTSADQLLDIADGTLLVTSCEYLLKFCVRFRGAFSFTNLNLVFPYQNDSGFVFLGEITFSNDPKPCPPQPELITSRIPPQTSTESK